MKKCLILLLALLLLSGCAAPRADIAASTLPVYEFTLRLCQGTDLTVTRLVSESVSCLHDYTLQVSQMRAIESAKAVVISGGGLEEFLHDALSSANMTIDASQGITLLCPEEAHEHHDGHRHEQDAHFWLSPAHAKTMAQNICQGLCRQFPAHETLFRKNLSTLLAELDALEQYGMEQLSTLSCRELITFHDGFAYFAQAFQLDILEAVEEESGSEASAAELIRLIGLVRDHRLPAIFIEENGSDAAAQIIRAETGAKVYTLTMAMSGDSYVEAMYHNIDTIKEALG